MQRNRRVLFLDIDGVVVLFSKRGEIDSGCCQQLGRVVAETGTKIVVSSNWKRSDDGIDAISSHLSIPREMIIGTTHETKDEEFDGSIARARVREICSWLKDHRSEVNDGWAVVDDMELDESAREIIASASGRRDGDDENVDLISKFPDHFVRTNREKGITDSIASELVKVLRSPVMM